jgi:rhodanese-related sulfurtransferase
MEKTITATELKALLDADPSITLLDVRRKDDRDKQPQTFNDATWQNPAEVEQWVGTIPTDRQVVIYCVRGGSVSQSVQQQLADKGHSVRYVEGGLEAMRKLEQG